MRGFALEDDLTTSASERERKVIVRGDDVGPPVGLGELEFAVVDEAATWKRDLDVVDEQTVPLVGDVAGSKGLLLSVDDVVHSQSVLSRFSVDSQSVLSRFSVGSRSVLSRFSVGSPCLLQ